MSNFALNLARRGAGLTPVVALQPAFTPPSAPDVGASQATEPGSEKAPGSEDRPELLMHAEAALSQAQVSPAAAPPWPVPAPPTRPPSQARTSPSPPLVGVGDVVPAQVRVSQRGEPAVPSPEERAYPTTAAESQPSPPQDARSPASLTAHMPQAEPAVRVSDRPFSPVPSKPATLPQPETGPAAMPAAIRQTLAHETPGASEEQTAVQIQPAAPPIAPERQAIIEPVGSSERPLVLPTMMGPTVAPPESRPIQVHIGTIEVRATVPPAPTPPPAFKPEGFGDYLALRTYANREDY